MDINIKYKNQDKTILFAAEELKGYLDKLSNPWQVAINKEVDPNLNNEGLTIYLEVDDDLFSVLDDRYTIDIKNGKGSIVGNNPRSVLLGVYKFLYLIGYRFLRPGEEYVLIPEVSKENLFVTFEGTAGFRHRGVCIEGANSIENVLEFIDWLPKLGFNSFFIQFKIPYTFLEMWYNHKYNQYLLPEGFDIGRAEEMSDVIDSEMEKRSLLHHRVGHGWTSEAIGQSALGWIQNDGTILEEEKEYLAMIDGKRDFFKGIPTNTNLCYSNPKVIEKMSNDIVTYSHDHPEVDFLHVWLADHYNNMCECDQCEKSNPTDQYIHLLNVIDEKMTKQGIDTKIVFLLYQELLWAPLQEEYKNSERFVLMFAPISRTFEKTYGDAKVIPETPVYNRNKITLPSSVEENIGFLKDWQKGFKGDGFVYDYPLGRAHYGDLGYVAISRVISEDIGHIRSLGLNGYISCQELRSFLPNGLPNYTMGLSLFNPDLGFEEIAEDYFGSAYGLYGQEVYEYLNKLSQCSSCDYFNGIGERTNELVAKDIAQIKGVVDAFVPRVQEQLKETTGVRNLFWEHLEYHGQYSTLLAQALLELAQGNAELAQSHWVTFTEFVQKNEMNYQKALDVYRVNEVATNYTGFKLTF